MERDYLKTIVHRIYARFMTMRSQLRQMILRSLIVDLNID